MKEKVMLGDFIYKLRKEKNLSQSELGELVGVTNKAVSKWETYEANPDLDIIKKLAEVLSVTADELLSCQKFDSVRENCNEKENDDSLFGIKGKVSKGDGFYEFVSEKKTKGGSPYIHINFGKDENGKVRKAKGVFALGLISKGLVSVGLVSMGLVSIGLVSLGLIALGMVSLGIIVCVGGVATGIGVSVGAIAIGTLAVGGVAIGIMSVGGVSIGIWAHTGQYGKAIGQYVFYHAVRYY